MLKNQILSFASFVLAATVITASSLAGAQQSSKPATQTKSIIVGPAVINDCKRFHLFAIDNSQRKEDKRFDIGVNSDERTFGKTRAWIVQNIWRNINNLPTTAATMPQYYLFFYSQPFPLRNPATEMTSTMLIDIPLNEATLGPGYQAKIDELRSIMTGTDPNDR